MADDFFAQDFDDGRPSIRSKAVDEAMARMVRQMDEAIMRAMGLTKAQVEAMSRDELKRRVHAFNYGGRAEGTQTGRFSSQPEPKREMAMDAQNIPKHELLLKILNMTTSDNDNTALVAIRKANQILNEAGWTWEKLLAGKIKVIGDPFAQVAKPPVRDYTPPNPPSYPTRPQPKPKPQYTPPPPPANKHSDRFNAYAGHCHQCGGFVQAHDGYIIQHPKTSKWIALCSSCNSKPHIAIMDRPAKRKTADLSQL